MDTSKRWGTFSGVPQTAHSALTPEGEIEQATKIAIGLRGPRSGWRKAVFRSGIAFMVLLGVALLSLLVYSYTSH